MTLQESRDDASPLILPNEPAPSRLSAFAQLVIAMVAILLVVGAVSVGTLASFTSSDDNRTPVFSVGTLILSNAVDGAVACLSTSGPGGMAVNDAECDGMFVLEIDEPGDGAAADIDLANVGTMDGDLAAHGFGTCTSGDDVAVDHHGTGDLCDGLLLSIQSYASALDRTNGVTTGGACLFGGNAGGEACDFDDPTATVGEFFDEYTDFSSTLDMGAMAADPGSTRFLRVAVLLPDDAGNTYQGRTASFGLTWRLVQ